MTERRADSPVLFHYADRCSAAAIHARGALLSRRHLATPADRVRLQATRATAMAAQVIWLTTEPNAYPDRIRFTVEPEQDIRPWSEARLAWPLIVVAAIEAGAVTDPRHWWIGAGPILVGLDVGASV